MRGFLCFLCCVVVVIGRDILIEMSPRDQTEWGDVYHTSFLKVFHSGECYTHESEEYYFMFAEGSCDFTFSTAEITTYYDSGCSNPKDFFEVSFSCLEVGNEKSFLHPDHDSYFRGLCGCVEDVETALPDGAVTRLEAYPSEFCFEETFMYEIEVLNTCNIGLDFGTSREVQFIDENTRAIIDYDGYGCVLDVLDYQEFSVDACMPFNFTTEIFEITGKQVFVKLKNISTPAYSCGGCNRGLCVDDTSCGCDDGWGGSTCNVEDLCDSYGISTPLDMCNGHGYCSGGVCVCENGYNSSAFCAMSECYSKTIATGVCSSHGRCIDDGTCLCYEHYSGPECEDIINCDGILASNTSHVCHGHGVCVVPENENEGQCVCDPSWSSRIGAGTFEVYVPEFCEIYITCGGIPKNSLDVCAGVGTCLGLDICLCPSGYVTVRNGSTCIEEHLSSTFNTTMGVEIISCTEYSSLFSEATPFRSMWAPANAPQNYMGTAVATYHVWDGGETALYSMESGMKYYSSKLDLTTPSKCQFDISFPIVSSHMKYALKNISQVEHEHHAARMDKIFCTYGDSFAESGEKCNDGDIFPIRGFIELGEDAYCFPLGDAPYTYYSFQCANGLSEVIELGQFCSGGQILSSIEQYNSSECLDFVSAVKYRTECPEENENITTCGGIAATGKFVCSGRGVCENSQCNCSDNYFGEFCELTMCNSILSNDTDNVCSGSGVCVDYNLCNCLEIGDMNSGLGTCSPNVNNEGLAIITYEDDSCETIVTMEWVLYGTRLWTPVISLNMAYLTFMQGLDAQEKHVWIKFEAGGFLNCASQAGIHCNISGTSKKYLGTNSSECLSRYKFFENVEKDDFLAYDGTFGNARENWIENVRFFTDPETDVYAAGKFHASTAEEEKCLKLGDLQIMMLGASGDSEEMMPSSMLSLAQQSLECKVNNTIHMKMYLGYCGGNVMMEVEDITDIDTGPQILRCYYEEIMCFNISELNTSFVCSGNGRCVKTDECACKYGYSERNCSVKAECGGRFFDDPNVCGKFVSNAGDVYTRGTCDVQSHQCECNGNILQDVDGNCTTCQEGFYGKVDGHYICDQDVHYCHGIGHIDRENVCSSHGNCLLNGACECFYGWYSTNYSAVCNVSKICNRTRFDSPRVCSGHGICAGSDECECDFGWKGTFCNEKLLCHGVGFNDVTVCGGVLSQTTGELILRRGYCTENGDCECGYQFRGDDECRSCADGFSPEPTCHSASFQCFGTDPNNPFVCSSHGDCVSENECDCDTNYGLNETCGVWMCGGVRNDDDSVCSANGACEDHNNCQCNRGYGGPDCSETLCFGLYSNDTRICSGNGECVMPNNCSCWDEDVFGKKCELFTCNGKPSSNVDVCGGHGICVAPSDCLCMPELFHEYSLTDLENNYYHLYMDYMKFKTSISNGYRVFRGSNCEDFDCFGIDSSSTSVCSSEGECVATDTCNCDDLFIGRKCQFKLLSECGTLDGYYDDFETNSILPGAVAGDNARIVSNDPSESERLCPIGKGNYSLCIQPQYSHLSELVPGYTTPPITVMALTEIEFSFDFNVHSADMWHLWSLYWIVGPKRNIESVDQLLAQNFEMERFSTSWVDNNHVSFRFRFASSETIKFVIFAGTYYEEMNIVIDNIALSYVSFGEEGDNDCNQCPSMNVIGPTSDFPSVISTLSCESNKQFVVIHGHNLQSVSKCQSISFPGHDLQSYVAQLDSHDVVLCEIGPKEQWIYRGVDLVFDDSSILPVTDFLPLTRNEVHYSGKNPRVYWEFPALSDFQITIEYKCAFIKPFKSWRHDPLVIIGDTVVVNASREYFEMSSEHEGTVELFDCQATCFVMFGTEEVDLQCSVHKEAFRMNTGGSDRKKLIKAAKAWLLWERKKENYPKAVFRCPMKRILASNDESFKEIKECPFSHLTRTEKFYVYAFTNRFNNTKYCFYDSNGVLHTDESFTSFCTPGLECNDYSNPYWYIPEDTRFAYLYSDVIPRELFLRNEAITRTAWNEMRRQYTVNDARRGIEGGLFGSNDDDYICGKCSEEECPKYDVETECEEENEGDNEEDEEKKKEIQENPETPESDTPSEIYGDPHFQLFSANRDGYANCQLVGDFWLIKHPEMLEAQIRFFQKYDTSPVTYANAVVLHHQYFPQSLEIVAKTDTYGIRLLVDGEIVEDPLNYHDLNKNVFINCENCEDSMTVSYVTGEQIYVRRAGTKIIAVSVRKLPSQYFRRVLGLAGSWRRKTLFIRKNKTLIDTGDDGSSRGTDFCNSWEVDAGDSMFTSSKRRAIEFDSSQSDNFTSEEIDDFCKGVGSKFFDSCVYDAKQSKQTKEAVSISKDVTVSNEKNLKMTNSPPDIVLLEYVDGEEFLVFKDEVKQISFETVDRGKNYPFTYEIKKCVDGNGLDYLKGEEELISISVDSKEKLFEIFFEDSTLVYKDLQLHITVSNSLKVKKDAVIQFSTRCARGKFGLTCNFEGCNEVVTENACSLVGTCDKGECICPTDRIGDSCEFHTIGDTGMKIWIDGPSRIEVYQRSKFSVRIEFPNNGYFDSNHRFYYQWSLVGERISSSEDEPSLLMKTNVKHLSFPPNYFAPYSDHIVRIKLVDVVVGKSVTIEKEFEVNPLLQEESLVVSDTRVDITNSFTIDFSSFSTDVSFHLYTDDQLYHVSCLQPLSNLTTEVRFHSFDDMEFDFSILHEFGRIYFGSHVIEKKILLGDIETVIEFVNSEVSEVSDACETMNMLMFAAKTMNYLLNTSEISHQETLDTSNAILTQLTRRKDLSPSTITMALSIMSEVLRNSDKLGKDEPSMIFRAKCVGYLRWVLDNYQITVKFEEARNGQYLFNAISSLLNPYEGTGAEETNRTTGVVGDLIELSLLLFERWNSNENWEGGTFSLRSSTSKFLLNKDRSNSLSSSAIDVRNGESDEVVFSVKFRDFGDLDGTEVQEICLHSILSGTILGDSSIRKNLRALSNIVGIMRTAARESVFHFNVTVTCPEGTLTGVDDEDLLIAKYDVSLETWSNAQCVIGDVDADGNTVSFSCENEETGGYYSVMSSDLTVYVDPDLDETTDEVVDETTDTGLSPTGMSSTTLWTIIGSVIGGVVVAVLLIIVMVVVILLVVYVVMLKRKKRKIVPEGKNVEMLETKVEKSELQETKKQPEDGTK